MFNQLLFEIFVAVVISFILLKYVLNPKDKKLFPPSSFKGSAVTGSSLKEKVLPLLEQGQIIQAVKMVRELTGMGLKDAKDYVDALQQGKEPNITIQLPGEIKLPENLEMQVKVLIKEGKKIEAIKLVRLHTKIGLKDAKEFVESLE
jgi:ribosomal protein L7/L12